MFSSSLHSHAGPCSSHVSLRYQIHCKLFLLVTSLLFTSLIPCLLPHNSASLLAICFFSLPFLHFLSFFTYLLHFLLSFTSFYFLPFTLLSKQRQVSVRTFQSLLTKFEERGRHRLYLKLFHHLDHSGVKGLLTHAVKDEVDSALKVCYLFLS